MKIDYKKFPLPKRFRHHLDSRYYIPLAQLSRIPYNYPMPVAAMDWSAHFSDGKPPAMLDIGCGFGQFLIEYGSTLEDRNILGIELRSLPVEWIQGFLETQQIGNVSVLYYSVVNGLPFIESSSVEKIFYFFPDPWYKRKHNKRRAFTPEFLAECFRMLKGGGELYLQTDIEEVHEYHCELLKEFGKFKFAVAGEEDEWEFPPTNKEAECIKKGYPYWRIVAEKTVQGNI